MLKLVLVVLAINGFFTYVGNSFLPQSESHPPKKMEIAEGMSQEDLIEAGEQIVFSKGQCMVCHPMRAETGMRAPAMGDIGGLIRKEAAARKIAPEEHLFEALVNPEAFVAEGFIPMMPQIHKPPTSLTEGEIIAVAAYLQSRGDKVSVGYPASLEGLRRQMAKAEGK
jgi:hypothetical protein